MRRIIYSVCFTFLLFSCKKEETVQPVATNRAPVANAGNDDTLIFNESDYLLDGRASYDPDKDFIQYTWRQVSGPQLHYFKQNQNQTTAAVSVQKEGVYGFELKVTDRLGLSDMDTMMLTVIDNFAVGKTPVININCGSLSVPLPLNSVDIYTTIFVENDQGKKLYLSDGVSARQIQGPSAAVIQEAYLDYFETVIPISNLIKGTYQFQIEVNRKGIKGYDTATVHVIDDSFRGKEYIFESKWEALDDQVAYAKTAERPEIFYIGQYREPKIFVLFENSTEWSDGEDLGLGYRYSTCYSIMEVLYYHEGYHDVVGKKVKIKVSFL
jgi:hypothetical protein